MRKRHQHPDHDLHRAALYEKVHPPAGNPPDTTVAELVRLELARERRRDAERTAAAHAARFTGGPCAMCGVTTSSAIELDGTEVRDWHTHPRGEICTWCVDWRGHGDDADLLDKIATILHDEGLDGLQVLHRLTFRIEPGLADHLGVTPWADTTHPPGTRWGHLAPIAEHLARQRAEPRPPTITWDDAVTRPGWEPGPLYGLTDTEVDRLQNPRTLTDADAAKLKARAHRQRLEAEHRPRRR